MGRNGVISTYCLYCEVAMELKVSRELKQLGISSFIPQEEKRIFIKGKAYVRLTRMLPRYVFFEVPETTEPPWDTIKRLPHVQKIIQYSEKERALRQEDLRFLEWVKKYNGILCISQVLQVGTKIQVIGGPLKDFEGMIVEVKKSRRVVAIQIGENGHFQKIWCPIEYVTNIL